jgi:hypothetical protein
MGKYFVSVELAGDPEWQIYPSVDALLGGKGFMRQVTASEGTVCTLPAMLYAGESPLPSETLAQQISAWIRGSLWPDTVVFVIEAGEWGVQYP